MVRRKSRAKNAKAAPKAEDVFYVGVQEPAEVRRSVLESYRDAVHFLQQQEKLKALRAQKVQALEELRADVRELKKLVLQLRRVMPKTKLRVKLHEEHHEKEKKPEAAAEKKAEAKQKPEPKPAPKKEKERKKQRTKQQPKPAKPLKGKSTTELERLESELNEIEHKLDKIT